ncbi:MAG: DUF5336 domain-containing protein [Pseudonocardiaceae bacterium]
MSVPYGQPPGAQQPGPPNSSGGPGLGRILAIATGSLGLVIYFLSFSDDAGAYLRTDLVGLLLLGGALLAVASVLPKAPATLVPAVVLVVTGTLFLLVDVINGPAFPRTAGGVVTTPGLAVLALVLAFLESAACVVALLAHAGVIKMVARPSPYPQPSWGPPPGGYPGGSGQGGYPAQQPVGPPPGVVPQAPQHQPYLPHTPQYSQQGPYSGQPGQYSGRQYGEQGQYGQYGDASQYSQYGDASQYGDQDAAPGKYGEPSKHGDQSTQLSEQPTQLSDRPARYSDQPGGPGQYGGQPGTPPGGVGAPDKS